MSERRRGWGSVLFRAYRLLSELEESKKLEPSLRDEVSAVRNELEGLLEYLVGRGMYSWRTTQGSYQGGQRYTGRRGSTGRA